MSVTFRDDAIYTLLRCRGGCQAWEIFKLLSLEHLSVHFHLHQESCGAAGVWAELLSLQPFVCQAVRLSILISLASVLVGDDRSYQHHCDKRGIIM